MPTIERESYTGLINEKKVVEIDLNKLCAETRAPLDFYIRTDNYFTIHYQKDKLIDRRKLDIWQTKLRTPFYILKEDKNKFDDYVLDNLQKRMQSEYFDYDNKADFLYKLSLEYFGELCKDAESLESMKNNLRIIEATVDFMAKKHRLYAEIAKKQKINDYNISHSVNVAILMIALAKELEIKDRQKLIDIGHGGILHDIGKVRISDKIIEKPGKLSEVEWEIMKQHSKNGVEIVMETGITSAIALMIISQHHENHASSGYPTGINSLRLSIYSNMAAIVDVYDAITSKRPYANRESGFNAVRLLLLKKKLYNAKILAKFIDMLGVDRGMNASAENLSGQSVF